MIDFNNKGFVKLKGEPLDSGLKAVKICLLVAKKLSEVTLCVIGLYLPTKEL